MAISETKSTRSQSTYRWLVRAKTDDEIRFTVEDYFVVVHSNNSILVYEPFDVRSNEVVSG